MDVLGTAPFAWTAVQGHLAVYYGLLWVRRRSEREYLLLSAWSAACAVLSLGRGFGARGDLGVSVRVAETLIALGAFGTTAVLVFIGDSMVRSRPHAVRIAPIWAGVGALATLAGLRVPMRAVDPSSLPIEVHSRVLSIALDVLGGAHLLCGVALACIPLVDFVQQARTDRFLRVSATTVVVLFVAGCHDLVLRLFHLDGATLAEHAALLTTLALLASVLTRFAETGEELVAKTSELTARYEELRTTQEQLVWKEQLAAVGELSAVIAHEVRNPLAIIKNALSGLRRPTLKANDRTTLLDILDEETDKLNRLMHDLLAYARPIAPKGDQLTIDDLLRRAVDRVLGGEQHPGGVDVVFEDHDAPHHVHGDGELLLHALVNIVDNALQAMPQGGRLTVSAREATLGHTPAVAVSFADTGEGMDTIVRSKARNPFFTTRPSGTGLGLAIVERVVRNHGGRVDIESHHGVGTTVTVTLPVDRTSMIPIPPPEGHDGRFGAPRGRT